MGCGASLPILSSINNRKGITDNSNIKSGKISPEKLNKDREKNLESFTLVCLDENFQETDKQLRKLIDYVYCFNNLKKCEDFILNNHQNNFLFCIISIEYFTNIISHIHDLSQILSIYVYQNNQSNKKQFIDKQWTKRYSKMKGVYFDRESLLEDLSLDIKMSTDINDLIPISVYSRIDAIQPNNSSTDHLRFLFYQLFLHQYCLNSSSIATKNDFLDIILNYYSTNRSELKLIHQFDDEYNSSKNILFWFNENTFIRRILTKSLLTLDIQILFSLRFFIKDMHKKMIETNSTTNTKTNSYQNGSGRFLNGRTTNEQIFYRGQALSKDTLNKIKSNNGEILSMNNFVLASRNRQDSLGYVRENITTTENLCRVLFEMKIPYDYSLQKQRPFIDLNYFKSDDDDDNDNDNDQTNINTILFFIGSIFRINNVVYDINNDCSIIQLTLYDEKLNQDFSQVFYFLNEMKRTNTDYIITLSTLLRQISPNSAEQFYEYLLKDNSQTLSKFECYRGLGLCSYSREDYKQALIYFEQALNLKPNDKNIKSSLHNNLGLIYAQQNQTDQALNHFNKALENTLSPQHLACVHHNLALIHSQQGLYQQELIHYQKALQIRTNQYPNHHLQMASLQNNLGIAYSEIQEYNQAHCNLRNSLETRLKYLSDNHIDIARTYANIGTVYAKTEEYRMALEYFNKAQLLFEKQQQIAQKDIEQLKKNIKIVNDKLRRKTC